MKVFLFAAAANLAVAAAVPAQVESTATTFFQNFESGPTRPLLLSPAGDRLFVLNTADARVEVYGAPGLAHLGTVFTGLEPVSMALHPDDPETLFVSNFLSDSVSVVDLPSLTVRATIPIGDEPLDLLVAGDELFVAVARARDESGEWHEDLLTVAQASPPYAVVDHIPVGARRPRALALGSGGEAVVVVPQNSGNHTTLLPWPESVQLVGDQSVRDAHDLQHDWRFNPVLGDARLDAFVGGLGFGWAIPETPRIVRDHEFPGVVPQLSDRDVVVIHAPTHSITPIVATEVGTTLYDVARNPSTLQYWVACTEAHNRTRMEYNLRGAAIENRIAIVRSDGAVVDTLSLDASLTGTAHALPVALEFHRGPAGEFAYVAAMGTATVLVLDAVDPTQVVAELAAGEMPLGLAVDPAREILYVFTRGDKAVRSYDIAAGHALRAPVAHPSYDPESQLVRQGRIHLYDARAATGHGNGTMACASCHVFGHHDALAWDLGDSAGSFGTYYAELHEGPFSYTGAVAAGPDTPAVHPMKGPMATLSLRGSRVDHPLHWRGDRRFFHDFRHAFVTLNGGSGVSPAEMQEFATFLHYVSFPPNPFGPPDREYTGEAAAGKDKFGLEAPGLPYEDAPQPVVCADCHQGEFSDYADFSGNRPSVVFNGPEELFNPASLRQAYEKEGNRQLTGFGLGRAGGAASIRGLLDSTLQVGGGDRFPHHAPADRDAIAEFVRQWDTGVSPLAGRQFTVTRENLDEAAAFMGLAEAEAREHATRDVNLIFKGWLRRQNGPKEPHGGLYAFDEGVGRWRYLTDAGVWRDQSLIREAIRQGRAEMTLTVVPAPLGRRLGIDRDEDGLLDYQEWGLRGTDPAHPDTDRDGFDDRLEVSLGTDPTVADASVPDQDPPVVVADLFDTFVDTATIAFLVSEPATALLELGTAPGTYDLTSYPRTGLRRRHVVIVDGLPADREIFFRITAADHTGNVSQPATGSFHTAPPIVHVEALAVRKSGAGPFTVEAEVDVRDHSGAPVAGLPVHGLWHSDTGDLGGQSWDPVAVTDASGRARFTLGPFTPAAPSTVAFTVAFMGSLDPSDPSYVGTGGDRPTFHYQQSDNEVSYGSVSLP